MFPLSRYNQLEIRLQHSQFYNAVKHSQSPIGSSLKLGDLGGQPQDSLRRKIEDYKNG